MALDTGTGKQEKDYSLIYYEIGINIFNYPMDVVSEQQQRQKSRKCGSGCVGLMAITV